MGTKEAVPFTRLPVKMIFKKYGVRWFVWFFPKRHAGLLRCKVSFLGVALFARSNEIHPCIFTTLCPGYHMVNCEIATGAAILTFKVVAFKYILPGKINALVGGVYISI